jgi:hypothetical protein
VLLLLLKAGLLYYKEDLYSGAAIKKHYISSFDKEFLMLTDIECLGYMIYLALPLITILIGL